MTTDIKNIEIKKPEKILEYVDIPEDGLVIDTSRAINSKSPIHLQQEEKRVFEGAGVYDARYVGHIATPDSEADAEHPYSHYALVSGKDWRNRKITALVTESGRKIVLKPGINEVGKGAFSVFMGDDNKEVMIMNGSDNNDTKVVAEVHQPSLDDIDQVLASIGDNLVDKR